MQRKRDRLEIIYTMLKIVQDKGNKIKKTPLLRFTNISSQSFKEYYEEVLAKEFIEEVIDKKGRMSVSLTSKGFGYLEKYKMVLGFIEEFEL